ncbi:MAG: Rpn family recombination-promoting nuclease/putative transposase, partial [Veillonellaceae bacterium]|nr:Rpn family recombination-promoting nuclease/putative transposase [Veillonellaceae bacterium]
MNDVLFKFIFGKDERKQITLDFLNAVLEESLGHT